MDSRGVSMSTTIVYYKVVKVKRYIHIIGLMVQIGYIHNDSNMGQFIVQMEYQIYQLKIML